MKIRFLAAFAVFAMFLNMGLSDAPKKADDAKKIQGTWKILSHAGGPGGGPPKEFLEKLRMKVTADELIIITDGKEKSVKYRLDPTKTPKEINTIMEAGDGMVQRTPGIYELNGDELKLCLPLHIRKGPDDPKVGELTRPKDFKSSEQVNLITLKREK